MRFHHAFGVLLICSSLAACSFKKEDGQGDSAKPAPAQPVATQSTAEQLTETNCRLEILETEEPGFYKLIVRWPKDIKRIQISVLGKTPIFFSSPEDPNFYETKIQSGLNAEIALQSYDSYGPASLLKLTAKVPQDILIEGHQSLTKNTLLEANRIFILPGAKILTNGYNLSIITNKLIAPKTQHGLVIKNAHEESHIVSFLTGTLATDTTLLKGSNISIQAKKAVGQLIVGMIGLNGRNGLSGAELESGLKISRANPPELKGEDGIAGLLQTRKMTCPKNKDGPVCSDESITCSRQPTNGLNGKQGRSGIAGENGMNGGDTGNLSVIVEDSSEMTLTAIQKVGSAGKGGTGGLGFPGGLGGAAGVNPGAPCASAVNGIAGPNGTPGPNGSNGVDGNIGSVITNIPKAEIFKF